MHHPQRIVTASSWLAVALCPALAAAAPVEFVEQRATYMIFDDVDETLEGTNWYNRDPFFVGYDALEDGFLQVHPDDSQFIVIYTTWQLEGAAAFYQSVANDVEGIGYDRIADYDPVIPEAIFDDTPDSQVQGMLHMSDWTQYLEPDGDTLDESAISLIFGQELGHAWLSFVYFDDGGGASDAMIGRQAAHWSFYLHSGGSPVQGHDWVDHGDGSFTAIKHDQFQFSDLDLYLMGLMPAEDVQPWFLIENPSECIDSTDDQGECAPPDAHRFEADQYRVTGTRRDITIEQVIAAEGPRSPAFPAAPDTFDVSFVLVKRPGEELTEEQKLDIDRIVDRSIVMWEDQTRGYGDIVNRTRVGGDPGDTDGTGGTAGDETGGASSATDTSGSGGEAGDETGPATTGSSSSSSTTTTTTGGETSADGDGTGGAADTDGTDPPEGCACSGAPGGAVAWAWPVLGWRRRRRGESSTRMLS